jgi:hypothetical protein
LVSYFVAQGIPARRAALTGTFDTGDIHLWPVGPGGRVCVEVKSGKQTANPTHGQLQRWMVEAQTEAGYCSGADVAVLVTKRAGSGHANVGDWWAHMTDADIRYSSDGTLGHDDVIVSMSVNALCRLLLQSRWAQ